MATLRTALGITRRISISDPRCLQPTGAEAVLEHTLRASCHSWSAFTNTSIQEVSTRMPRGRSIVCIDKFIEATRDSGYKGTAHAVSELVDNSIQAGAGRVTIVIEAPRGKASGRTTRRYPPDRGPSY
jgi:hypothetical protein